MNHPEKKKKTGVQMARYLNKKNLLERLESHK